MILFANISTGIIETSSNANTIPVNILTDVKILLNNNNDSYEVYNNTFKNNENNITNICKQAAIRETDTFIDLQDVRCIGCNNSDIQSTNLMTGIFVNNQEQTTTCNYYKLLNVNEQNSNGLLIDDIMEQDMRNILESSAYDYSAYFILDNIVFSYSTFISYNRYKVLLKPNDSITINIQNVDLSSDAKLFNVNSNATVVINNNSTIYDEDGFVASNISGTELNIVITNDSDKIIELDNPYILFN